uniref:Transposase InsH N-terminal domain-containing protein n=1 Tax=mine drainage metagenome TaxID=410659 RepID=E6QK08_9ZZZZ
MARFPQALSSQASFEKHGRKSKRELFLDPMNQVVPWTKLLLLVEPHYPRAGNVRQPVGPAIMLRAYFLSACAPRRNQMRPLPPYTEIRQCPTRAQAATVAVDAYGHARL